ncbi:MAG: hypothetical protein ACSHYA_18915 [Opitutaceae bacterium]
MIKWNEVDFIECLGVVPETEADGVFYSFKVIENGIQLKLSISPYAGDAKITLSKIESEEMNDLIDIEIIDCQMASVKKYGSDKFIEFAPGRVFGGRYDENFVIPFGVRVHRHPHLKVSMFSKSV